MKKIFKNKQTLGKKPWVAVLLVMALSFGACLETKKSEDDISTILGVLLLNQQSQTATTTEQSPTTCSETTTGCRIFLTAVRFNGNLGGVAGADEKCNADSNKPTGNFQYKALIVDATNRTITITGANTASPEVSNVKDWPLKASTKYFQKSGAEFATTTAGGIFLNGTNAMRVATSLEGMRENIEYAHNGIAGTATMNPGSETCTNWTTNEAGPARSAAAGFSGGNTFLRGNWSYNCDQTQHLICVEQ